MSLIETLHGMAAMAGLELHDRPWGAHWRGKRWGGRREERGGGADWLGGGRGRMGEMHQEDLVPVVPFSFVRGCRSSCMKKKKKRRRRERKEKEEREGEKKRRKRK
jgi:hypothetical protein